MNELAWHLVYTERNAEVQAMWRLVRQGFDTFLPFWTEKRVLRGRRERVRSLLFPNYIFVAQDSESHRFAAIEETQGVLQVVKCGDAPIRMPPMVIENIVHEIQAGRYSNGSRKVVAERALR